MHNCVDKLIAIQNEIQEKSEQLSYTDYKPNIVAISKTFSLNQIIPLIHYGHFHFGENKVQEALEKWSDIKNNNKNIKLHMVGKLQTNKAKLVVPLFDYLHSLDNLKLAEKISNEQIKINKKIKIFIQVNLGNESQKSGINKENLENFFKVCQDDLGLSIVGLMCLPPKNVSDDKYFLEMLNLSKNVGLSELSMGMSDDYLNAIKYRSTFLRIGTKIFGSRA
tara:strand:- start:837 stop:1502 length:666 start_codon:yes stop_codon:yes gene_type:complete